MTFKELPDGKYFKLTNGMYGPIYAKLIGCAFSIESTEVDGQVHNILSDTEIFPLNYIVIKTPEQDEYDSYMAAG